MRTGLFLMLLSIMVLVGCAKPKTPKYLGYSNLRLEKVGLANTVVAADLRFYNPNNYALKLKRADMDVYVNDRLLGHSVVDTLLTLPGRDSAAVPLQLQLAGKGLLSSAGQLLLNPNVRLRVDGTAKVGRGSLFIDMPVKYEGVQHIDLLQLDREMAPAQSQQP